LPSNSTVCCFIYPFISRIPGITSILWFYIADFGTCKLNIFTATVINLYPFTTDQFVSGNAVERGVGILSVDAHYTVEPLGGVPNTFQELNYGIHASAFNPLNTLTVDGSEFIDNKSGISLNGIDYATITSNNFVVGPYSTPFLILNEAPYGIYLNGCTGYQVENNQFTALPFDDKTLIGSIILNSGSLPNIIYKNKYEKLLVGCLAQGNNRRETPPLGLQIKCNEFTNLRDALPLWFGWDIAVTFLTMAGPGIAEFQGACNNAASPAGNRFNFSDCVLGDDNISNGGQKITYSHHTDLITTPQPGCHTPFPKVDLNPCFSINGDCPSPSGCIIQGGILICLKEIDVNGTHALDFRSLIDGGNTQFLIGTIEQGNPGHILNTLMNASPYLSDEVLIAAINSKPPLPPGILQQILIANSPLTDEVMDALNNIFVPNGVMNQINAVQTGISERTKLESKIAYHLSQRALILNEVIRFYLNSDTLPGAMDSVIAILKREDRPARKEQLVAAFILEEEFTRAEQEITQLHPNGNLDNFCKIQSVLIELGKQGKNIKQMDVLQEQTVRAVAADTAQKACAHAQAMLKVAFNEDFREIIVLPAQNQNKMAYQPTEEKTTWLVENHILTNFPNPFSDYTTIEAYLPDNFKKGEIVIYNLLGIVIKKYAIEKGYNAVTVLKDDMPPASGIFFYALKADEQILEERKMIIIK